jgi:serine/threonine protein kinase
VLYAMLYGTVPFKASTMDELHDLILKGKYTLGDGISAEAKDLINHILELDPKKRYKIPEILAHKWFEDYDDSCKIIT